ncbi:membrane protein [Klebsiella pneumoniae]|uniref:Membrane protein n=2 Tax=Klebsiella pneumoniae TaxID=573 RepID=A0A377W5V6_KLEPN|nr:membrane protein [Klebsiella pneumoniae]STT48621.1 membrane protein [Klebsiella pneumoniae]
MDHQKVTIKNRYGITLAADVYLPKDRGNKKLAALVISGPFGAVKEQASGLYAQTLAERGFVTLAFDPSYTGESSGEPTRKGGGEAEPVNMEAGCVGLQYTIQLQLAVLFMVAMALAI